MTPRQVEVLDFIRDRITGAGFAPTYQEIGARFDTTKANAHRYVEQLERAGKVRRLPNRDRGIELSGDTVDLLTVDTELLRAELARRGVTPGALLRPAHRPRGGGSTPCAALGCDVPVRRGHAFCWNHWTKISPATQQLLQQTHRIACMTEDHDDALRYQEAFGQAKDEAETRR